MGAKQSSDKDARLVALKVLRGVLNDGESLTTVLPPALETCSNQDRAFAQMLVYGVLRFRWQIEAILGQLLARPLKAKDSDLKLILMLAVFQLLHSRVPDYATVDAAVKQVKRTGKSWARGLVNGVLRSFQRQQDELLKNIESDDCAAYSHPQWIIEKLQADWPEHWHSILEANNQQAPMVLRVNARHFSAQEYADKLSQSAEIDSHAHQALVLQQASDVTELPGYTHGWFSVQDAGAQLAADLLDARAGDRVLDACAAPGGKTCHLLELESGLHVVAVDIAPSRLKRIEENLQRLELSAELVAGDAATPGDWWDGQLFDRILLDAPCSASGVIRRHPDIKSLRRAEDIPSLVELQQTILQKTWSLLKPGGELLYVTCSVFKEENELQIEKFLGITSDAQLLPINADWGHARPYGQQILPGEQGMDGFYYAKLQKKP